MIVCLRGGCFMLTPFFLTHAMCLKVALEVVSEQSVPEKGVGGAAVRQDGRVCATGGWDGR